jgi:hypothetical protein
MPYPESRRYEHPENPTALHQEVGSDETLGTEDYGR